MIADVTINNRYAGVADLDVDKDKDGVIVVSAKSFPFKNVLEASIGSIFPGRLMVVVEKNSTGQ
jgi:hypothetical protein